MIRLGLSGGIGAGKSTVAQTLIARGAYHVDADKIAREVVEPGTEGLAALVEAFGTDILGADGALDRPVLAARAFADDEQRARLNAITHPLIGARTQELLDAAPPDAIVLHDIPLLVEGSMAPFFHLVMIVHADADVRVGRVVESRGMGEADARARVAAQATDEQRRDVADIWLDNSGDPDRLAAAAIRVWEDRLVPFERNVAERIVARGALTLAEPDPGWAQAGARLVNRLWALAGDRASSIDHIGSTSVPGLLATPTIDLQLCVTDMQVADALADDLADGGFPRVAGIDRDITTPDFGTGVTESTGGEARVHGSADPGRLATVHIRVAGSPAARFAVDFRDWLRDDEQARAEYAAVKRSALSGADGDLGRYVEAKGPWFDEAFTEVARWRDATGTAHDRSSQVRR